MRLRGYVGAGLGGWGHVQACAGSLLRLRPVQISAVKDIGTAVARTIKRVDGRELLHQLRSCSSCGPVLYRINGLVHAMSEVPAYCSPPGRDWVTVRGYCSCTVSSLSWVLQEVPPGMNRAVPSPWYAAARWTSPTVLARSQPLHGAVCACPTMLSCCCPTCSLKSFLPLALCTASLATLAYNTGQRVRHCGRLPPARRYGHPPERASLLCRRVRRPEVGRQHHLVSLPVRTFSHPRVQRFLSR